MSRRHSLKEILDIAERQGSVFEASREVEISSGNFTYSLFRTGSKPVILFAREIGYDGEGVNAFSYRAPTLTSDGSKQDDIRNPNDINPKATTVELFADPTFTDIGTETRSAKYVFASTSNQGSGQPIRAIESPQFLLPNTDIILAIENRDSNSTQNVAAELRWAELDRIPGLYIKDGAFYAYTDTIL